MEAKLRAIAPILRTLLDGPKSAGDLVPRQIIALYSNAKRKSQAYEQAELDTEAMAIVLNDAESLGFCSASTAGEGPWQWKLTPLGQELCQATIERIQDMAQKSRTKTEPEQPGKTEQDLFDEAVLKAVRLGATSYTTVKNDVVKAQRITPKGIQGDWPREFELSLLRLIKSGKVAVTNGRFWARTGTPPSMGDS